MTYVLAIGDRSYSSWSLRGWLMLARFDLPVTLRQAELYSPEIAALRAEFGGSLTVPALRISEGGRDYVLWESLALAETLASATRTAASGPPTRPPARWPGASRRRCTPASPRSAPPAR